MFLLLWMWFLFRCAIKNKFWISGVLDVTGKLEVNDFCLIIMDPGQMHLLQKFGQGKIVCLDGTHGFNGYDFEWVAFVSTL